MKQTRLDEILAKGDSITTSELAEICGATLLSVSRHCTELKQKVSSLEKKVIDLEAKIKELDCNLNPAFGVIVEDFEEEEEED
jgi:hypothetical protein